MSWDEVWWMDGWESIYADTTWELFFLAIYTIEQCVLKCEYEFSRSRVKIYQDLWNTQDAR